MNIFRLIWSKLSPDELEKRYIVKNSFTAPKTRGGGHLRGIGYTRASKKQSKTNRKIAAKSRNINRRR